MPQVAPTLQSSVCVSPSTCAPTILVTGGSGQTGTATPTIPLGMPIRQETKEAFDEVSSAFQDMSAKHGQIQGGLQVLASMVEALRRAKQGEMEAMSQVWEMLKRTAFVASELEIRLGEQSVA